MLIEKTCQICGKTFYVPHWRKEKAKYCSVECQRKSLHGAANVVCTNCGNSFHMKPYRLQKYARHMGYFCSRSCETEYRKAWFAGSNNHQYGLKGSLNSSFKGEELPHGNHNLTDVRVYAPYRVDANKHGRVVKHRLLVEQNWSLYPQEAFEIIKGQHVLKKGYDVHHADGNHNNNAISNLIVLTRNEHTNVHNRQKHIVRDHKTGRITSVTTDRGTGGYGSTGV